ncbi:hypothetical protein LOZ12_006281 [Ophidiomyces ophidiicola]|uniref:Uncharacterized protein n=1 Tax=Ophidiomyces ophidiicola TaxID=1387563 RepID=A0ACB8UNQ0_9EURO|nr:uncharacterized protein LOZ57_001666 [Ophidiomyces ophidiicola]KAI1910192.1 hypothetical protein LOZ61_004551 [Ophidiomyces ophidiicola]KAI1912214.1 hypothetical protein LOZ64_004519 [Ophidiomyces ophidiicola]KAI1921684.1 hypothetical protein LOZ60_006081 [Ophidiomyces ophidiicola]KAI1934520.1 hypothetical protein LOZ62_006274 [Ophidiomyces ophidiicola]KAI1948273.1 hypothetical protein LOZ59_006407 [Ophidiomyces ophidiicola]
MVAITVPETLEGYNLSTFEIETEDSTVYGVSRGIFPSDHQYEGPILVLIHGYPQTYFMWRHVIKLLPKTARLFVPDIPGYGNSSPCLSGHDKSSVGKTILKALSYHLESSQVPQPQDVILIGHDRGARISHRLSVDAAEYTSSFTILGAALMDIVPTTVQWQGMSNPAETARTFHWPFLANAEYATQIILQIGGDHFIRQLIEQWMGNNESGRQRLRADDALEIYQRPFRWDSVVRCSCLDYQAGATVDVAMQKADQEQERKVDLPVLVLHCSGIGRRFDMNVWRDWVAEGKADDLLKIVELGNGVGHFVAEEDPEGTVAALMGWITALGVQFK